MTDRLCHGASCCTLSEPAMTPRFAWHTCYRTMLPAQRKPGTGIGGGPAGPTTIEGNYRNHRTGRSGLPISEIR